MQVEKRDGTIVAFDKYKIRDAILKAFYEIAPDDKTASRTAAQIADDIAALDKNLTVEEIQDEVEIRLMNRRKYSVARGYANYRYLHSIARSQYSDIMQEKPPALLPKSSRWSGVFPKWQGKTMKRI